MVTTTITVTDTYQKVGSSGAWSVLQNIGSTDVEIFLGTVVPTTQRGFRIKSLDGVNTSAWGDEDIYARTVKETGTIVILK